MDGVIYSWRGPVSDGELFELVESHAGTPEHGWWDRIRPHSLGWVTARDGDLLVGFVKLHVDFEPQHHTFYIDACAFEPTDAGLIHLR